MKVSLESFSVFEMLPKRFRATGGARLLSALSVRKALRAHGQGRRNCRNPPAAPGSGGGGLPVRNLVLAARDFQSQNALGGSGTFIMGGRNLSSVCSGMTCRVRARGKREYRFCQLQSVWRLFRRTHPLSCQCPPGQGTPLLCHSACGGVRT